MRKLLLMITILIFSSFIGDENRLINFPRFREKASRLPEKDNFWIFLLAGQSNMAGRGLVEPQDTLPNNRIVSLWEDKSWYIAKEPLHFYEPDLTGLDCGLSFANELLPYLPDSITIGLVPCAVGGSEVIQWNNDSTFREVTLLSNFRERVDTSLLTGTIKAILWHQGESDAHSDKIPLYEEGIEKLFFTFRQIVGNDTLPILVGELASFMEPVESQLQFDSINAIIHQSALHDKFRYVIPTNDLTHKGDHLHFDSPSQRAMGERFADAYVEEVLQVDLNDNEK